MVRQVFESNMFLNQWVFQDNRSLKSAYTVSDSLLHPFQLIKKQYERL